MERSLHRQLKEQYGLEPGGRTEVVLGKFRVDAEAPDGRLIEIQSSPLGLLGRKLDCLLPFHRVDVIKPVVYVRRVIWRDTAAGADLGSRQSPKRGRLLDAFEELVGLARLFPHPNLRIKLVGVEIDEIRLKRRRKPGFLVVDRILRKVVETLPLELGHDLWSLLPVELPEHFTSEDLAHAIGRPADFARRVAYCLLHAGAAEVIAKRGNRRVYARTDAPISEVVGSTVPFLRSDRRRAR